MVKLHFLAGAEGRRHEPAIQEEEMRTAPFHVTQTHPLGAYADQSVNDENETPETDDDLVIPESFEELADDGLNELHDRAVATFEGIYGDGSDLSDDDLNALASLTEGIEAIKEELGVRDQAKAERVEKAAELANRVKPETLSADPKDGQDDKDTDEDDKDDSDDPADSEKDEKDDEKAEGEKPSAAETVTAAATSSAPTPQPRKRAEVRVDSSRVRRHLPKSTDDAKGMRDIVYASGEGSGYAAGQGIDWEDAGKIVDRRLAGFNQSQYQSANRNNRHMRQQMGVMSIRKPLDEGLIIDSSDPIHVEEVLSRATSEARLPNQSLVASGGWCAPSEVIYDLLELESRDGIFSLPEVGITRGGITRTLGPDFADIYNAISGFHYTEQEDIDGNYDGEGGGSKPCYKVECPDFEEFRLEVDGLCITAGLLQQRGYPEVIARTLRGALIAHDHRLAGRSLAEIEAGSTPVSITADEGATSPLLSAIELQAEHLRYQSRISRSATIEGVFPFWVRGAIRADLSKRNGVNLLDVSDAQINNWFSQRGVSPQFVYNWQDINGVTAGEMTGWPTEVTFLMYPAGTWVRGTSDIITVDTLFDSTQLGQNDYTALFTEEGWLILPMGHHSRAVSVALCADGTTAAGIDIACNGVDLGATTTTSTTTSTTTTA